MCKEADDMDFATMKQHMRRVHAIDISGKQYSKNMLLHLDGSDSHFTQYEWDIEGIKMIQGIRVMRQSYKDRMARKEAKQTCKTCAPSKPKKKFKRLEDTDKFPFGQYRKQDKTFNEVPAEYLDWLHGQPWIGKYPAVLDYIERNRKAIDMEMKRNTV